LVFNFLRGGGVLLRDRPIGIFDSGMGGLTVVKEVFKLLPQEDITYFADTAHLPYGERELSEVKGFALNIMQYLIKEKVKLIIMGCNVSSAIAIGEARKRFEVPVIGLIEAGVEEALAKTKGNRLGLIATSGTIKSKAYQKKIKEANPEAKVFVRACPLFVPLIEEGKVNTKETIDAAKKYLKPLITADIDTLILGCTHYPFLERIIQSILGKKVKIVDPARGTVIKAKKIMMSKQLLKTTGSAPRYRFIVSGESKKFKRLGSKFLGRPLRRVEQVRLIKR